MPQTTLTLVLPASEQASGGENRYTVTAVPGSYETAAKTAIKVFGKYIGDKASLSNIILRMPYTREGKKIWADIDEDNWSAALSQEPPEISIHVLTRTSTEPNGRSPRRSISRPVSTVFVGPKETYIDSEARPTLFVLFVLEHPFDGQQQQRILIPLPETYKDGQRAALRGFRHYLSDITDYEEILLRPTITGNISDCANIQNPDHWKSLFPQCRAVGVSVEKPFANGRLWITRAQFLKDSSGMLWTPINPYATFDEDGFGTCLKQSSSINRPESYQEAINSLERIINLDSAWKTRQLKREGRDKPPASKQPYRIPHNWTACFYVFRGPTSQRLQQRNTFRTGDQPFDLSITDSWYSIPFTAQSDDAKWRWFVPPPGSAIGFLLLKTG
ncbi:hypothetical protein FA15DRAFT_674546 [Coprinopsis marcescibilis]|uniref:Uncharacterized protein n=1 Tax=Coprinopsis marcescibilis TaxID=230819 RepID=A0A5C3KTZ5_COPMA|nr:hypothetical protein FA15DRAFT_674546 [Coprinopsis marcescibilis]